MTADTIPSILFLEARFISFPPLTASNNEENRVKRHTRSNEPLLVTKKHSCHSSNRSFHGDGCLTVTREKISMVMPSRINKN